MKKKIFLTLITIISLLLFTNKVEAIVMWMQCTDDVDDKITGPGAKKSFDYYSSFAVINNKDGGGVRHIVYDSKNGFYSGKYPTFILYHRGKDGTDTGNLCWYSDDYDSGQKINECDEENYFINASELLEGVCPTKIYDAPDGFMGMFADTAGAIQKDLLILQGQKKAKTYEPLTESLLVIYGFRKEEDEGNPDVMVESYYAGDGRYSFGTTWKNPISFAGHLNMPILQIIDADNEIINKYNYNKKYMDWPMQSQARRIGNIGKDYFKLLDTQEAWLVGAVENQRVKVVDLEGPASVYRSDDGPNEGFGIWTKEWYNSYANELEDQIEILEKFNAGGEYYNLVKTSQEISDKIDEGKKYNFDESLYTPEKMVEDLNKAYQELSMLINSEDTTYVSYNDKCEVDPKMTHDPVAAAVTSFNCEIFGVNEVNNLPISDNGDLADLIITYTISKQINDILRSDIGIENIREKSEEYAKLLAKSSNYIKKNIFFSDKQIAKLIDTLSNDYQALVRKFGVEIVLDCESLIGKEMIDEIKSYLDIIKIAIPIILMIFGIIDFTKALFGGDEEQMKKAQKNFIKRLGVAILIFLVPTIVNLILSIANKVWIFIGPSSCGLFEI